MKKTLIFSDVHLKVTGAHRSDLQEFVDFLRAIDPDDIGRVICLGDLFDFWFEYKHAVFSDCFEVLRAFADLHSRGVELHLICGNHDFWAGRFLRESLGFHVHPDSVKLPFGEKTAYLVHGDGVNPRDWSYRIYKSMARNPFVVWAFRMIHPDWAMGIARMASKISRALKSGYGTEVRALEAFARGVIARGEAGIVLCGHAHARALQTYPGPDADGLYVNPGDWLDNRSYVVWDGREFQFHEGTRETLPAQDPA